MDLTKNLIKGPVIGIFIVLVFLLSSALSWGDTRLMVDQATDGSIRATIWDGATLNTTASSNLPGNNGNPTMISCEAPIVDWDSSSNSWVIFGANIDYSMWAGTIKCTASGSPCTIIYTSSPANTPCSGTFAPSCLTSTGAYSGGTVVNGVCGSATTGGPYTTAPTTNLCSPGTASTVTLSGSQWTWTCQGSGTGATSATCYASYSSGGGGGGTPGCPTASSTLIYIPSGAPSTGGGLGMSTTNPQTITAYGEKHYFFCLATPPSSSIQISMATEDWQTNQDILVSNVSQPSCSQDPKTGRNVAPNPPPWYNILSGSTESVLMAAPANKNLVYYVTVCSQSNTTGKYGLYWVSK